MTNGPQTLEQWISEALNDTEKVGELSMLSLMHHVGLAEREIYTIKSPGNKWTTQELGKVFRKKATDYSAELDGVQQFILFAFYGGRTEPEARKPFRINGQTDLGQLGTEGPTGTGLTQQAMRHSEAIIQLAFKQTGMLFSQFNDMLSTLQNQNHLLMTENRDALNAVKEMILSQANNRHAHEMEQLKYERSSTERRQWLQFVPALINSITGREVFPQSTEDSALIESLIENISEDDILLLSKRLPAQLWGPLAKRMEKSLKTKRLKRESDDRILATGVNPEADARGEA